MKRVNFVTNLDLSEISGGGSAVNSATYDNLSRHFKVNYVGPIDVGTDYPAKLISKLRRVSGLPGNFHFFSPRRLKTIAQTVTNKVDPSADCDFFHGPTSWILYNSPRPYFVYTDACFSTYIDVFHDRSKFLNKDVKRICDVEAAWLKRAERVFFRSRWAQEEAIRSYSLPPTNLTVVGRGVNIPLPDRDVYNVQNTDINFLFVAANQFENKGGRICCEAFMKVREHYPHARMILVGVQPPPDILALPNVIYRGFLRKTVPEELRQLQDIYASAFALIHPTSFDTNPLVITEAGCYGCPSIASRSFGIPELIEDGITGFLIAPPLRAEEFARQMLELCRDPAKYSAIRKVVRTHSTSNFTWEAVGDRIAQEMYMSLENMKRITPK